MKKLLVFLALASCLSVLSQAAIEKKYDRITEKTTIKTLSRPPQSDNPQLYLAATYEGKNYYGNLAELSLVFVSWSDDWKYRTCNRTQFLIDGIPYDPGKAVRKEKVRKSGGVTEFLVYSGALMPFEAFQKLAAAKKIEVKICDTEFVLSEMEMDDLKEFVRLLAPQG